MQDVETAAQKIGSIPPNAKAKVAKIGPFGAGKSTNIASVASALTGRVEKPAGAGRMHGASTITDSSTVHKLQYLASSGNSQPVFQPVNILVVDTPGSYFDVRCLRFVASSLTRTSCHRGWTLSVPQIIPVAYCEVQQCNKHMNLSCACSKVVAAVPFLGHSRKVPCCCRT